MKSILLLLLLLPGLLLGCQNNHQNNHESISQGRIWGDPFYSLRCSIAVEKTSWSKGDPALVSVVIENISKEKVNFQTTPIFMFLENGFWCPVDIAKGEYTLPTNAFSTISLDKGAILNRTIDLSKLKWDMPIASSSPENSLYTVSPGKYSLRLEIIIEIEKYGSRAAVDSNVVEVNVGE